MEAPEKKAVAILRKVLTVVVIGAEVLTVKQGSLFKVDSVVVAGRLRYAEAAEIAELAKRAKLTQAGYVSKLLRDHLAAHRPAAVRQDKAPAAAAVPAGWERWSVQKRREWKLRQNRKAKK